MKPAISAFGYTRVMTAALPVFPGDIEANVSEIIKAAERAKSLAVEILVLPELALTGYTCGDLFFDSLFLQKTESAILALIEKLPEEGPVVVFGAPICSENKLYNAAVVMSHGCIHGIVPKRNLPNYNEFYERRWFSEPSPEMKKRFISLSEDSENVLSVLFGINLLFHIGSSLLGVEICEDLWVPNPPSLSMAQAGATVIANLSATPESIGKHRYLADLVRQQSARCRCAYLYASAGNGESSTDLVFAGNAMIAEDGAMIAEGKRFSFDGTYAIADIDSGRLASDRLRFKTFNEHAENSGEYWVIEIPEKDVKSKDQISVLLENGGEFELIRDVAPMPFVPSDKNHRLETCMEIIDMQAWGLAQRLKKIGCRKVVIGISGGLDSTLALLVADKTFKLLDLSPEGIIGITMPGFGTTDRTHNNARTLMEKLGITILEIPIGPAVEQHFKDIGQDPNKHDATYENSQARERTQILMDMANKENAIVVGTGDLSELALGWCTYNGDHMSMYAVNTSIPKTLVGYLVETFAIEAEREGKAKVAETLRDIVATPISPELIPANNDGTIRQKTEDLVGPYELHDFFLYHLLRNRFSPSKIFLLALKAFAGKYDVKTILHWLRTFYRRFFNQQFKRSCLPDGPKVGSVCLSPRGDWRMPSDISSKMWLDEIARLEENFNLFVKPETKEGGER